jgi:hypothetical protein
MSDQPSSSVGKPCAKVSEPEAGPVFEPYESPPEAGARSAPLLKRFANRASC